MKKKTNYILIRDWKRDQNVVIEEHQMMRIVD
jgi:hypothetical protein